MTCCNVHQDYKAITDKGFDFIKSNIKWSFQFIHLNQENILAPKQKRNINDIIGCCYLTKSKNKMHLKCISNTWLNSWNPMYGIYLSPWKKCKKPKVFSTLSKVPKLLNLFITHTNKPSYTGDFQITFHHDLLIPALLHIFQHSNHLQTLDSILNQLSYTLKCNHSQLLTDKSTTLDTLQTFNIKESLLNVWIINTHDLLMLALISQKQTPTTSAPTWNNSPATSTPTYFSENYKTSESSTTVTRYPPMMQSANQSHPLSFLHFKNKILSQPLEIQLSPPQLPIQLLLPSTPTN